MIITCKSEKIQIIPSHKIDKKLWDKTIDNSFNGNIFFTSWFLDIITSNKWKALIANDYSWLIPLPLSNNLISTKYTAIAYFQYTTTVFKNPGHIKLNWKEFFQIKRIKTLLTHPRIFFKYFPDFKLIQPVGTANYEIDLPGGLDLLRNHSDYRKFNNPVLQHKIYANTSIPLKGIQLFIDEHYRSPKASVLKKITTAAASRGRLISIGIYNKSSRLVAFAIALIFRSRINLIDFIADTINR